MINLFLSLLLCTSTYCAPKELPLTYYLLELNDGVTIDEVIIENTLWLINEIQQVHQGLIKINGKGEPSVKNSTRTPLTYKNKPVNLKALIELEGRIKQAPIQDQQQFERIFQQLKLYFALVNESMLAQARGAHVLMKELIKEFCEKRERPDSLLLNWEKGKEVELYKTTITSFKILYTVSIDLQNFLTDFINSCPHAKALYLAKRAKQNAPAHS
jgi:hypothetical protein